MKKVRDAKLYLFLIIPAIRVTFQLCELKMFYFGKCNIRSRYYAIYFTFNDSTSLKVKVVLEKFQWHWIITLTINSREELAITYVCSTSFLHLLSWDLPSCIVSDVYYYWLSSHGSKLVETLRKWEFWLWIGVVLVIIFLSSWSENWEDLQNLIPQFLFNKKMLGQTGLHFEDQG